MQDGKVVCMYCKVPIVYDRMLTFTNMTLGIYKCPQCSREYVNSI